jgi:hypothetical protein
MTFSPSTGIRESSSSEHSSRRRFLRTGAIGLTAGAMARAALAAQPKAERSDAAVGFQYESLRWIDERDDPSLTLETEHLVAKVIDNSGLKVHPSQRPVDVEPDYSHSLGYHGIRSRWSKAEKRNIVAPFVSWLNLQGLQVEGLKLDPIDSRARYGVARGWPIEMQPDGRGVVLKIRQMPVSGIEYSLRLQPAEPDTIDFEVSFTLHRKTRDRAKFTASWPCYMSAYDDVQLFSPVGDAQKPQWHAIGEKPDFVIGETVNYVHTQRGFWAPEPAAFPAVFGCIGARALILMVSRPDVRFYLVNAGGHRSYFPVQNPAWDFQWKLPDYDVGKPFGFKGRLIYQAWTSTDDVVSRYHQWKRMIES